jgi:hypothetical protein
MSLARVYSAKARKTTQKVYGRDIPLTCGVDGKQIEVGETYYFFYLGYRAAQKTVRCTKHYPKQSERESSLLASVYAAQEDAEDQLEGIDARDSSDADSQVTDILQYVIDAADEVVQQYREADENFGGGGNTDSAQRADDLEAFSSDLQSFSLSVSDPEGCGDEFKAYLEPLAEDEDEPESHDDPADGCEQCEDKLNEWRETVRDEVREAITSGSF